MIQKTTTKLKRYFYLALTCFPSAAIQSMRLFGGRGLYLAFCVFIFRRVPFPLEMKNYGLLATLNEATNFIDNFCLGELRSEKVEDALKTDKEPWIIDVGVNVGLTIRWWLSLRREANVIGVDMFQESLDFTSERIRSAGLSINQWHPTCGAVGDSPGDLTVHYDNPLEGTNNTFTATGPKTRTVKIDLLDHWLGACQDHDILLLKIDIEGAGGLCLRGAPKILKKTRFVIMETHSEDEIRQASEVLLQAGFILFRVHGRTIWWEAGPSKPNQ